MLRKLIGAKRARDHCKPAAVLAYEIAEQLELLVRELPAVHVPEQDHVIRPKPLGGLGERRHSAREADTRIGVAGFLFVAGIGAGQEEADPYRGVMQKGGFDIPILPSRASLDIQNLHDP